MYCTLDAGCTSAPAVISLMAISVCFISQALINAVEPSYDQEEYVLCITFVENFSDLIMRL